MILQCCGRKQSIAVTTPCGPHSSRVKDRLLCSAKGMDKRVQYIRAESTKETDLPCTELLLTHPGSLQDQCKGIDSLFVAAGQMIVQTKTSGCRHVEKQAYDTVRANNHRYSLTLGSFRSYRFTRTSTPVLCESYRPRVGVQMAER